MSGVSPGTGGRPAVRGLCRDHVLAGIALLLLCCSSASGGEFPTDPLLEPPMSPREARQDPGNQKRAAPSESADWRTRNWRNREQPPVVGEKLADVIVEGNTTIESAAILQKIKTQPGRPPDPRQIQADIRTLFGTRWFLDVAAVSRRTDKGLVQVFRVVERPIVKSVQYLGNKQIKTKDLAAQTGLKVGSPFDVSANREAAKRLDSYYHEKGYTFATVDLETGGSHDDREVVFRIVEGPRPKVVWRSFTGNQAFSDDLLVLQLKTSSAWFALVGGKYDPAVIPEDVAGVRQYYENLGYFDVKVEPDITFSKDRKWIYANYKVQEGLHYKIRSIAITGNSRFNDAELMKGLKTHEGQFYNARLLSKDVTAIKDRYGKLGYTFIAVEIVPRYLEEPGNVDLLVRIDEDRQYTIRQVTFHIEGDHPRTKRTVPQNYMPFAPGDPADPKAIEQSKRKLGNAQIFATGTPGSGVGGPRVSIRKVGPEDERASKDPSFRGQNGDGTDELSNQLQRRAHVAATPFLATPSVKTAAENDESQSSAPFVDSLRSEPGVDWVDGVVREQIGREAVIRGQNPGDPFAAPGNPLINPSPQGNPLINPSPQGDPYGQIRRTPTGEIDLDYYLAEERTGRLMFGVGVNSSAGVVGTITLQEQNFDILRFPRSWTDFVDGTAFRGAGQRFRVEAIPGTQVSRYTVSWTDPYFLDTNYSVGLSGFYFQRFYRDWTEERAGGRVSVGRQLSQYLSVTGALRLEDVKIFNPKTPTPEFLQESVGDNFLSTARGAIVHDTRDSTFLTGEGHRVELSYEQGFGQFVYPRAEIDARQYYTIYRRPDGAGRQILTVGGQVGFTDSGTPIFERYFAGGFQSFRGFQFRGVSPQVQGVQVGGRFMAIGTVEYMVPLLVNEMVQGVVFSDFGTVDERVTLDNFRVTVGAGFRLTIPAMGPVPLAFDFGIPVLKQKDDLTQVFSFYVGLTR